MIIEDFSKINEILDPPLRTTFSQIATLPLYCFTRAVCDYFTPQLGRKKIKVSLKSIQPTDKRIQKGAFWQSDSHIVIVSLK